MDIWQLFELSLSPLRTDYFYMTLIKLWLSVTVCVGLSGFLLSERTSEVSLVIFDFLELLKNVGEMRYCRTPEKKSNNNYWTPWFPPRFINSSWLLIGCLCSGQQWSNLKCHLFLPQSRLVVFVTDKPIADQIKCFSRGIYPGYISFKLEKIFSASHFWQSCLLLTLHPDWDAPSKSENLL